MSRYKKLTLLHSNDLHGNFLAAEVEANGKARIVSTSCMDVVEDYLSNHQHLDSEGKGRLIVRKK